MWMNAKNHEPTRGHLADLIQAYSIIKKSQAHLAIKNTTSKFTHYRIESSDGSSSSEEEAVKVVLEYMDTDGSTACRRYTDGSLKKTLKYSIGDEGFIGAHFEGDSRPYMIEAPNEWLKDREIMRK